MVLKRIQLEIRFLFEIWAFSLASAMQYRVSFIVQVVSTILNDIIYFIFWLIFFKKFQTVGGYSINNMLMQFSVVTAGFGLAFSLFGNTLRLAGLITRGVLDYYLVLPKNVLGHMMVSNFSVAALGDLAVGIIVFLYNGNLMFLNILLWIGTSVLVAIIFIMFNVLIGSASFWLGNAEGLVGVIRGALTTFSLYPNHIFGGITKFILLTLIPATFLGAIPVKIITTGDLGLMLLLLLYTLLISIIAIAAFYIGLHHYESSNSLNINV